MVSILNGCGPIPPQSEVVIAVPSIHILSVKAIMREDIAVAAQVFSLPLQ